jgi:hypothetical protein
MKSIDASILPLLNKAIDHSYNTFDRIPQWNDYILIRYTVEESKTMSDFLFIPDLHTDDESKYFMVPCNSLRCEKEALVPGVYPYRLGKKYGAIYGQQMGMVFVHDGTQNITNSDFKTQKLLGVNMLFNPIHRFLKPTSPVSKVSPGSITVSKEYYKVIEEHWNTNNTSFDLFVVHLSSLI